MTSHNTPHCHCMACDKRRESQNAWRKENADKVRAWSRGWKQANREKYNAYMREFMREKRLKERLSNLPQTKEVF